MRPAWRDSDPRWRRRMIAGAWIMVLIPLVSVLRWSGATAKVPVILYNFQGWDPGRLEESFVFFVFPYLAFCVGVVLFFSKERGRRSHSLDWTRRWGVLLTYLVLLIGVLMHALLDCPGSDRHRCAIHLTASAKSTCGDQSSD